MSGTSALDWRALPLDAGRILIEASAGTGKTWTIGAIFLRLLLERDLRVDQILVVTFTDAAAQELRERLRARLAQAEDWLAALERSEPIAQDDPVAQWLAAAYRDEPSAKRALRRIRIARMDFDRAPIATIHALCQRIQNDFPLEAGASFAANKRLDENALLRECVEDFWRQRYLGDVAIDPDEADIVLDEGPEKFLGDVSHLMAHDARVLAADGFDLLQREMHDMRQRAGELRALAKNKVLFAPRKTALCNRLLEVADALECGTELHALLFGPKGKIFESVALAEQQAPGVNLAELPLIQILLRLRSAYQHRKVFVRGKVLAAAHAFCERELPRRAAQREGQTFSMLIASVHQHACEPKTGLAMRLHEAFPVALIDEFQDTDARQFEIFDRIYRDSRGDARGLLLLIGDPKQAIYGFRGGDIGAYLRVRKAIAQRFDLMHNFRSSPALIASCNALYAAAGNAFDDVRLHYVAVEHGRRDGETIFSRDGAAIAQPLAIHAFAHDGITNKDILVHAALADCATRIVELLNDAALRIGMERVQPGDIAVLVPNNHQIGELRQLLRERGVPCVGSGKDSVFDGDAARELQLILHGVLHADDDRAVRGALCTVVLGKRFADLRTWQDDTAAFERELDRFAHWQSLARTRGALGVIADILDERAPDLLAWPDGERIVADLRHLGELLAEREAQEAGLEGACAWLAAMRAEQTDMEVSSGAQTRSASDASCVRLLTLHAAKGLEFPIVFLPLAWHTASRKGQFAPNVLRYHDADDGSITDIGSADFDANLAKHFSEDFQERLRLLYVAITRAKFAVHVYWMDRHTAVDAPLWDVAAIDHVLANAQAHFKLAPGEASLRALAQQFPGMQILDACANHATRFAPADENPTRAARTSLPALREFLWSHSFSSIVQRRVMGESESIVGDERETPDAVDDSDVEVAHPDLLALDVWRGPTFGDAVHAELEAAMGQAPTLEQRLDAFGVRPQGNDRPAALAALTRMLARVREADLGDGLCLAALLPEARIAEFGFRLPVDVGVSELRAVCARHGAGDVWPEHLAGDALRGMLTGYADLIVAHGGRFHVLDYKTNWLGTRVGDYTAAALDAAMRAHKYPLQALLYTIALHRYLRVRLHDYSPSKHLGDSWYLFLRAVGLAPDAGVWRHRWPVELIEALDVALGARELAT